MYAHPLSMKYENRAFLRDTTAAMLVSQTPTCE